MIEAVATVRSMSPPAPIVVDSAIVAALGDGVERVNRCVDPRDEMLVYASAASGASRAGFDYFRLGHDAARTVDQIASWAFPHDRESIAVLEFACGYGRVMRHLALRFAPEQLTGSDIDPDAIAFVSSELSVRCRLSVEVPEQLHWAERYDLIVVPSLFSHLPGDCFGRWLASLYRLLSPRGVLAFSVHGDHLVKGEPATDGLVFKPVSEATGRLHPEQYGTSFVTERYVADSICRATGDRRYQRIERGFWDHQDLYVVAGPQRSHPAGFCFLRPVAGNVDRVDRMGDTVTVLGWARAEQQPLFVEVVAGDRPIGAVADYLASPDVAAVRGSGFEHCRYAVDVTWPAELPPSTVLSVTGHSDSVHTCFYAQRLETITARSVHTPAKRRWWRRR